jgi:hypothetical protein
VMNPLKTAWTRKVMVILSLLVSPIAFAQIAQTGGKMQNNPNASFWRESHNGGAIESDAEFENYKFRDGEVLPHICGFAMRPSASHTAVLRTLLTMRF